MAGAAGRRVSFLQADGDELYWQEGRPDGSTALVRRRADGRVEDIAAEMRSRVYEYGGRAFAVRDGRVVHVQEGERHADHFLTADHRCLRVEEHGDDAVITLDGEVVASGRDFYGAPREHGGRIAYLAWDHPDMPWDAAELWVDGERMAGGDGVSCMQPTWGPDGSLYWIDDRTGWWNLYRDGQPVAPMDAEFGYPAWQLGYQSFCLVADGIVAVVRSGGLERLVLIRDSIVELDLPFTEFDFLVRWRDGIACVAGGPDTDRGVVAVSLSGAVEVLRPGLDVAIDPEWISRPEHVSFSTAHALFYPPSRAADAADRPPVIVLSHGGPTAHAGSSLDLEIQFFTSRGYAVADVNYRGSTGYGRAFRDALRGQWGIADVEDCVACVEHLAAEGRVDGARAVIRGGSAGGYTTLQALTTTDAFAAGSSHYGVADLGALAADTHKFEARYLDQLVGPWPEARAVYEERSALNHLDGFSAPVILFQGLDDKVVPPDQARRMAEALAAKGLEHELHLYEGEEHGFRRAETRRAVAEAELAFLERVLSIGSRAS